ncbi:melanoregulin [Pantherophis guttatus]|uniref:Melanoregulin n=1 Tax=Pantherophis guttatus TaxID=94885 RepID=A0ABM3ZHG8_PANGU|nr:melanoregulin [Pantherophis guttatus]
MVHHGKDDTFQYFNKLQKRRQSEAANLWNEPADSAHVERGDDHELHKLLEKRSKMHRGSEGYRRLSFDIIAHRQIRRKVKDRWKHILEVLGFKAEADGLLTVTSCTSYESLRNPQEACRLHTILAEQTSIFGHHHGGPPERYLFVLPFHSTPGCRPPDPCFKTMDDKDRVAKTLDFSRSLCCHLEAGNEYYLDRLVLLDVGDDFLSAARHFYPAEEEEDSMSSSDGGPSTPGPVLVQLNNETPKEAEVEEGEELKEDYTHFGEAKGGN